MTGRLSVRPSVRAPSKGSLCRGGSRGPGLGPKGDRRSLGRSKVCPRLESAQSCGSVPCAIVSKPLQAPRASVCVSLRSRVRLSVRLSFCLTLLGGLRGPFIRLFPAPSTSGTVSVSAPRPPLARLARKDAGLPFPGYWGVPPAANPSPGFRRQRSPGGTPRRTPGHQPRRAQDWPPGTWAETRGAGPGGASRVSLFSFRF